MSYPVIHIKYRYRSLTSSRQNILKYNRHSKHADGLIIIYNKKFLDILLKNFKLKKLSDNLYCVNSNYHLFLSQIGAPNIAICVEEYSEMGYKKFITLGVCGAISSNLDIGDIIICDRAVRDEGTSYHYLKPSEFIYCDKNLLDTVEKKIKFKNIKYHKKSVWTTDAPYRETSFEVKKYLDMNIDCVDMETSALYCVAKYKKVKALSVFLVSDIINHDKKKWSMAFNSNTIYNNFLKVFKIIVKD
jgi:purine-nucleoside phosphorylase